MSVQKALVIIAGQIQECPAADTLANTTGGSATINEVSVAFTDEDLVKRVNVTNGSVTATSKITLSITRPNINEEDDPGFVYLYNVVKRASGSFDVLLVCLDTGGHDTTESPPNETILLHYLIG